MGNKYDEAFDSIVFLVAVLFFGGGQGKDDARQRLVRYALIHLGVRDVIAGLEPDNGSHPAAGPK